MVFWDGGSILRSAGTAVLVANSLRGNTGKEAWLFVTGPVAKGVVVCRVEL
jgi:hypothetical protein